MALMPTDRMDPPPGASPPMRMTASWSGSNDPTVYKFVARRCPQWRAPLGSSTDRHRSYAKAPVAVHHRSACSGVKALPNTSHAKAASRQALLAFRSLDPFRALRQPDRRRRDEERPSRSEQRTLRKTKINPLDRKSPIQVRILFPPAESPSLRRIRFCRSPRLSRGCARSNDHRSAGLRGPRRCGEEGQCAGRAKPGRGGPP